MKDIEKALVEYDTTFEPLTTILARYDISLQKFMRALQLRGGLDTSPRIKKAVEIYSKGDVTLTKVAELVGCTRQTLKKYFNKMEIEIKQPLRIYEYNDDYFEKIDTEEKAYWLGFIYADGSIVDAPNGMYKKLEIGLKESDRGHLVKFLNGIGGSEEQINNRIIKLKGKEYGSSRVCISCTKMCEDLIRHGATQRKSLTLKFPQHIHMDLLKHFLRGYFDGDGCISYRKGYDNYRIALVGTEDFLSGFLNYFKKYNVRCVKMQQKSGQNAFQLEKAGLDCILILNHLYEEANVYLERKFDLYLDAIEKTNYR